ncbi:MAG: hypothetical protein MJB57_08925 [Gemmatimonadetes bacterium]|nr:hypothetical protein [Gemmatimonadota bacterium]
MKRSIPWGRLALEFFVIVLGVLVALGVDQWVQGLDDDELVEETLRALAAELAENDRTLGRRLEYHERVLPALKEMQEAAEAGRRISVNVSETLPEGLGLMPLRRTAWEMVAITEAVRHFELPLLSFLSATYAQQDALKGRDDVVSDGIIQPESFGAEDQTGSIIFLSVMLTDVATREDELRRFYAEALRLVRERLGDPEAGAAIEIR